MEERLKLFLSMEGLSPSQFADKLGIQRSGVSHLLSGRNKPSFEFINKMLLAFPKISPDWLILGTGKAYRDLPSSAGSAAPSTASAKEAPAPAPLEAKPEEIAATSIEPDLFLGASQPEYTVQESQESPAADAKETAHELNRLRNISTQKAPKTSEPDRIVPKNGLNYPRENSAERQPAPAVREKRIAQITILYTDGTFEVR